MSAPSAPLHAPPPSIFFADPSTEIKLCRHIPQGLPEDTLFLGENEFIDFSASREQYRGYGVWIRTGRGPAPSGWAGRGQQRVPQGPSCLPCGPSFKVGGEPAFPPTAGLMSPPPAECPGSWVWHSRLSSLTQVVLSSLSLYCYLLQAWNVRGAVSIYMGDVKKEFFSYSSTFSMKDARTRGLWFEVQPQPCVLFLSAHDRLLERPPLSYFRLMWLTTCHLLPAA